MNAHNLLANDLKILCTLIQVTDSDFESTMILLASDYLLQHFVAGDYIYNSEVLSKVYLIKYHIDMSLKYKEVDVSKAHPNIDIALNESIALSHTLAHQGLLC
ncbi:hypothetical protein [Shewanella surugensis]|uniref:Uncharacterized protein n=1 Tax=Shewanella surugensis TaxID=212020 RepID=A0ABT0LKR4_9GAMM|nr:hypothetical protein [Shewanella surugensis]MCL1128070.1 hypothetical protein [Shewanella surugensis]